ncbi:MAG: cupin domain-containing protein [Burkholderiaceae bacterium]|nr:cupin domain-containing protein [Burkholderiaceae bacterium]
MDTLSQLLLRNQVQVELEIRCLLSGSFAMVHDALPAGGAPFHLLLSGSCRLQTARGQILQLEAGDFVLFPHGEAHTVFDAQGKSPRAPGRRRATPMQLRPGAVLPIKSNVPAGRRPESDRVDLLCGRYTYARSQGALLMQALPEVMHVNLGQAEGLQQLQALIAVLRSEAAATHAAARPGAHAIVNALGQALLAYALRAYGQDSAAPASWLALAADARLGSSVQAMLRAPEQPWTIATLGEVAAMSRATYARQFQEKAGMSVGDFLARIRMLHAATLLTHTSRRLADIGAAVGYQSEAAFGKAFRAAMGQTPGQWRQEQKRI